MDILLIIYTILFITYAIFHLLNYEYAPLDINVMLMVFVSFIIYVIIRIKQYVESRTKKVKMEMF